MADLGHVPNSSSLIFILMFHICINCLLIWHLWLVRLKKKKKKSKWEFCKLELQLKSPLKIPSEFHSATSGNLLDHKFLTSLLVKGQMFSCIGYSLLKYCVQKIIVFLVTSFCSPKYMEMQLHISHRIFTFRATSFFFFPPHKGIYLMLC